MVAQRFKKPIDSGIKVVLGGTATARVDGEGLLLRVLATGLAAEVLSQVPTCGNHSLCP